MAKNRTNSGQQRLSMVINLFRDLIGGRPFTTDELATWSIANGLYPTPMRGSSTREDVVAWEARYDQVKAKVAAELARPRSPLSTRASQLAPRPETKP